jgi:hypothetical protein
MYPVMLNHLNDWESMTTRPMLKSGKERDIVLITGNRNAQGADSLEMTIRHHVESHHLPVFTISDPGRLMRDRYYAEEVAASLIEHLERLENLRGAGRLYLP